MPMLDLDVQVCHSLYSATNALIRAYRPLLEPLGLTYPQYVVMMSLWQKEGVSVKALSEHTRLDSGTLTPILKRLEKQQLLTRKIFEGDERQKRICLSSKGKKLKEKAESIPEKIACITSSHSEKAGVEEKTGIAEKDLKNAKKLKHLCEELFRVLEAK
ncbi:MAG: MarR family winged helix-turn-helix transcriptional regulator [Cellvibrionaceae bacterium]